MMKTLARTLLPLSFVSVFSCSTKISYIEHDPTFTEQALQAGGLAIGGIATVETSADPHEMSRRYAPLLRRKLVAERPVPTREWGEVKELLGDEAMTHCLLRYRDGGRVDAGTLEALHGILDETRYVVFARIEGNVVEREESDHKEMQDGKMETVGYKRKTKRKVTVGFRVYDLQTGAGVWNAVIEGNDENEKTTTTSDEDPSLVEAIVEVILEDNTASSYPDAPDLSEVLEKVFARFAKQVALPEKK